MKLPDRIPSVLAPCQLCVNRISRLAKINPILALPHASAAIPLTSVHAWPIASPAESRAYLLLKLFLLYPSWTEGIYNAFSAPIKRKQQHSITASCLAFRAKLLYSDCSPSIEWNVIRFIQCAKTILLYGLTSFVWMLKWTWATLGKMPTNIWATGLYALQ